MQTRSERNRQKMSQGSGSQAVAPIEISVKQEVDLIPLFRGNTEGSDFSDGTSVSLEQWFKSLESSFITNRTPVPEQRILAYKYVDKRLGDASQLLAHLLDAKYATESWQEIKDRIQLIYPTHNERNYCDGIRRTLFVDCVAERKHLATDVDKLRRNVAELTKLYLEKSGNEPIDGSATEPISHTVERLFTNLISCKLFSNFLNKEVARKVGNKPRLDEVCNELLTVGNSLPTDQKIWSPVQPNVAAMNIKGTNNKHKPTQNRYTPTHPMQQNPPMNHFPQSNPNQFNNNNYQQRNTASWQTPGTSGRPTAGRETRTCFNCKKVGHLKRDCRLRRV